MKSSAGITETIAHTDIVQEADRALELEEHGHHRVNLAGVHIDDIPPHAKIFPIEMPTNLDRETIAGICIRVVHVQHGILSDDELVAFIQFRDYLTLVATAATASRTNKEIKQRFRSDSGSRIVSLLLADPAPAADGLDREASPHSPASDKVAKPKGQTKQIETLNPKIPRAQSNFKRMERDSSSMSSGRMQRKDGKNRMDSVDAKTEGKYSMSKCIFFLSSWEIINFGLFAMISVI
jgi:hypothetical protein